MDARAARLRMFVVFQDQHAATAGDDEAVAVEVVGARCGAGRVVMVGGQRAHRIELRGHAPMLRSEEHTSELQSLMRTSYAVFCFNKNISHKSMTHTNTK